MKVLAVIALALPSLMYVQSDEILNDSTQDISGMRMHFLYLLEIIDELLKTQSQLKQAQ